MFFREKSSKQAKRPTLQLVENYRDGKNIKQHIVTSLGVGFPIAPQLRQYVADAVQHKLLGQQVLFENAEISDIADRIVKKIATEGRWQTAKRLPSGAKPKADESSETAEVYIDQVEHSYDRILGPVLIGHTFWQRLGFEETLRQCHFNNQQIKTAEVSVLDRLIAQDSEHSIPSWIKTAAVEELIDKSAEAWGDDRFYRVSDLLLKHQQQIEQQLYQRERDLFNLDNSIYLYDLTNTYFEGLCQNNPKAQFNKNQKEKRTDCRQIVIALVLNQDGFVRRHHVFEGNMSDVKSLAHILDKLTIDFQGEAMPTIIMDRGVVCDENMDLLNSKGLNYIVAARSNEEKHVIDDFMDADFKSLRDDKNNPIAVFLKQEENETYLLCKSRMKQAKEQSMRNQAETRLDQDLAKLEKLIQTGQRTDPRAVERSIGRINERHARVAHYYSIEYTPFSFDYQIWQQADGGIATRLLTSLKKLKAKADQYKISHVKLQSELEKLSQKYPEDYLKVSLTVNAPVFDAAPVDEKRRELTSLDGNYLIKTNREDLSDSELWNMYTMLTRVEAAFRNLKTDLKLQPNYHQLEVRVEGHVFITILAYHLLHAIEQTLRQQGCSSCWATIKRVVTTHTYSSIILPTTDGSVIHLRKPGRPEAVHEAIYRKLQIDVANLPTMKIVAR